MIFLWELLIIGPALVQSIPVHKITNTYSGTHSGWITLSLDHSVLGTKTANLKRIDWCGAISENPPPGSKLIVRELQSCSDPGLRHLKLFPGSLVQYDEPNVVYIDPVHIGGWDDTHQAQIVVRADFDGEDGKKHELIQTFRFNPLFVNPIEEITSPPDSSLDFPSPPSPPSPPPPPETSSPIVVVVSPSSSPPPPSSTSLSISWTGMATVLGVGFVLLAIAGYAASMQRNALSFPRWGQEPTPQMTLRLPSSSLYMDDDDDILDANDFLLVDKQEEESSTGVDLQFMMDLGANSAFIQNY